MKLLLLSFPPPLPPNPCLLLKGICGNCCRERPCVGPSAPFPHYSLSSPLAEAPGVQGHGGLGPGCHHLTLDPSTSPVCRTIGVNECVHVCLGLRICGARGRQGCIGRALLWLRNLLPVLPRSALPCPW